MPCLAETVLKATGGQPAFQQLKGATALYCLLQLRAYCAGGSLRGILAVPLPVCYRAPLSGNWHYGLLAHRLAGTDNRVSVRYSQWTRGSD